MPAEWKTRSALTPERLGVVALAACLACFAGCGGFVDRALACDRGTVFFGCDVLAAPDTNVRLTARVLSVRTWSEVDGATVEFVLDQKVLGTAQTDGEGYATIAWHAGPVGDYAVEARIARGPPHTGWWYGDLKCLAPAPLLVAVRPRDARVVVLDLDQTVVESSFKNVLRVRGVPCPGAADVVAQIAERYTLIYLTRRMDIMTVATKAWLARHGFPRSPLIVSTFDDAIGSNAKFKSQQIAELRKTFPHFVAGVGDLISDAQAYMDNYMTPYLIPQPDRSDQRGLEKLAAQIRALPPHAQVVANWGQVRLGLLEGASFPPEDYARELDNLAKAARE